VKPILSGDGRSILLAGETLTPDAADALVSALHACAKDARREAHEAARLARAADAWAALEGSILPLGEVAAQRDPRIVTPARLHWDGRSWETITPTSGMFHSVSLTRIVSIPAMLVRDHGARTRHWWAGTGRALCGKLVDARPETDTKHAICVTCASRHALGAP
jgi:hypothetical protein